MFVLESNMCVTLENVWSFKLIVTCVLHNTAVMLLHGVLKTELNMGNQEETLAL